MPAILTEKGITWGYTDGEDGWGAATNNSLRLLSEGVPDAFAYDPVATTGLQYAYRSGSVATGRVAGASITLAPNTTNYVERTAAGVVSTNTAGFTADRVPMAVVVTNVGSIASVVDRRPFAVLQSNGVVGGHAGLATPNTFAQRQVFNDGARFGGQGIVRPDNGGSAFLPGNGVNQSFGTTEFRNVAGTTLNARVTDAGVVEVGDMANLAAGLVRANGTVVGRNVVAQNYAAIPQILIDTANTSGFEGRLTWARATATRYAWVYDRNGDDLRLYVGDGTIGLRVLQNKEALFGGRVLVGGGTGTGDTVEIAGTFRITGNVFTDAQYNGSGAGLTSVPWSALNAGTVPGNVANAITQAQGDGRYRQLGNVPWVEVTKPAAVSVPGLPGGLSTSNNWEGLSEFARGALIDAFATEINAVRASAAAMRDLLISAGFAS